MADDWDLFAVVRSCCSAATSSSSATATSSTSSSASFLVPDNNNLVPLSVPPDPFETKNKKQEDLQELYKSFFVKSNPLLPISPLSVLGGLHDVSPPQRAAQPPPLIKRHSVLSCVTPSPKSKRRKNQKKMVCQVAAEDLSSDTWSWRKYGQKPIKGSPYPRGYYKCSTSKGCLARKQVERNRSDPGMFIVTYTADHNHPMPTHRSSLSGISRLKPDDPTTITTTEKKEKEEEREDFPEPDEEEDEFDGSDMVVGDDFFEGLEDFTGDVDSYPVNKSAI